MVGPDDGQRYSLVLGVPRSLGALDLLYLLRYAYIIYTYMVILAKIDTWIVMNDIPTLYTRQTSTRSKSVSRSSSTMFVAMVFNSVISLSTGMRLHHLAFFMVL